MLTLSSVFALRCWVWNSGNYTSQIPLPAGFQLRCVSGSHWLVIGRFPDSLSILPYPSPHPPLQMTLQLQLPASLSTSYTKPLRISAICSASVIQALGSVGPRGHQHQPHCTPAECFPRRFQHHWLVPSSQRSKHWLSKCVCWGGVGRRCSPLGPWVLIT